MSTHLKKIDYFREYEINTSSKTTLGGILTILIPFVMAGYISWLVIDWTLTAPTTTVEIINDWSAVFKADFRCEVPSGCFFTQNYMSNQELIPKIEAVTGEPFKFGGCSFIAYNQTVSIPMGYVSDPIDGPTFVWKRQQNSSPECSTPSGTKPVGCNGEVGVAIKVDTLVIPSSNSNNNSGSQLNSLVKTVGGRLINKAYVNTEWVSLFYGIHSMAFVNTTYYQYDGVVTQANPLQLSSETIISNTNICCPSTAGSVAKYINDPTKVQTIQCTSDGPIVKVDESSDKAVVIGTNNGNANDFYSVKNVNGTTRLIKTQGEYYQLKIRIFPSYTLADTNKASLLVTLFSQVGGALNIVIAVFTGIIVAYRALFVRRRRNNNNNNQIMPIYSK